MVEEVVGRLDRERMAVMVGWGERLSTVYRGEKVEWGTVLRKIGKKD